MYRAHGRHGGPPPGGRRALPGRGGRLSVYLQGGPGGDLPPGAEKAGPVHGPPDRSGDVPVPPHGSGAGERGSGPGFRPRRLPGSAGPSVRLPDRDEADPPPGTRSSSPPAPDRGDPGVVEMAGAGVSERRACPGGRSDCSAGGLLRAPDHRPLEWSGRSGGGERPADH